MDATTFDAAIFDLDGLLIDSEPLWRLAEVEVFGELGVPLTEEMCHQTTGLRVDAVVEYWFERYPWPLPSGSPGLSGLSGSPGSEGYLSPNGDLRAVADDLVERVRQIIEGQGQAMPGVYDTIDHLKGAGFRFALASSSPLQLIETAVRRLALQDLFEGLFSAMDEERGKPDPAVYQTALDSLGVEAHGAVAFEDSLAGVQAAKGAGLKVVAVPAAESFEDPGFGVADWKLRSLREFSVDILAG